MRRERIAPEAVTAKVPRTVAGRRVNPVAPALLGAACISSSAIVVRLADVGAGTTSFYRCVLALPLLTLLAVVEQRRHGSRSLRSRALAGLAGVFLGVDLVLWTRAIYDVGAGIATVLGNLQVLFVTFFAWIWLRERPRSQFLVALPVVLFGVVLLAGLASTTGPNFHPVAGVLFGFGASITYSVFILMLRANTKELPHVAGPLADATGGAALASLVFGLALGQMRFSVPLHALGWLVVLALTSQTLGCRRPGRRCSCSFSLLPRWSSPRSSSRSGPRRCNCSAPRSSVGECSSPPCRERRAGCPKSSRHPARRPSAESLR